MEPLKTDVSGAFSFQVQVCSSLNKFNREYCFFLISEPHFECGAAAVE